MCPTLESYDGNSGLTSIPFFWTTLCMGFAHLLALLDVRDSYSVVAKLLERTPSVSRFVHVPFFDVPPSHVLLHVQQHGFDSPGGPVGARLTQLVACRGPACAHCCKTRSLGFFTKIGYSYTTKEAGSRQNLLKIENG
jgi:hypothetical protein